MKFDSVDLLLSADRAEAGATGIVCDRATKTIKNIHTQYTYMIYLYIIREDNTVRCHKKPFTKPKKVNIVITSPLFKSI